MWAKAAVIGLLLMSSSAHAGYITYSQWASFEPGRQSIYIAGAFDLLVSYAPDAAAQKRGQHFLRCVMDADMKNGQLSDNVLAFARATPEVQKYSPMAALIRYLNKLCGEPG